MKENVMNEGIDYDYIEFTNGRTVVSLRKEDGMWREASVIQGKTPRYWGGKSYETYLDQEDIAKWLQKDYGGRWEEVDDEDDDDEYQNKFVISSRYADEVETYLEKNDPDVRFGQFGTNVHVVFMGDDLSELEDFKQLFLDKNRIKYKQMSESKQVKRNMTKKEKRIVESFETFTKNDKMNEGLTHGRFWRINRGGKDELYDMYKNLKRLYETHVKSKTGNDFNDDDIYYLQEQGKNITKYIRWFTPDSSIEDIEEWERSNKPT